ncbi:hypothetical protein F4825DRAFT_412070 [Nemania diffusa]|nr:hypothetical protein F4825DRAFT_412070 [Nemania diffusa]
MHRNAMRWLGRSRWPAQGTQAFFTQGNRNVLFGRLHIKPELSSKHLQVSPLNRTLWSSSRFQTKATSESAPLSATQPSTFFQAQTVHPQGPRWIILALVLAASAGTAYLYRRQYASPDDDVINMSTFSPFIITDREQVSPTAFIIALRPSAWVDLAGLESGYGEEYGKAGFSSKRIQEAWRHGLWSVEIKQPQLQIARHYTPLPPLSSSPTPTSSLSLEEKPSLENVDEVDALQGDRTERSHKKQGEQSDLRILIRRMDGGEMSNYLSRQRVGDTIWLRGPHLGFDVPRRLGLGSVSDGDTEVIRAGGQRGVIFLAGGTGIAPALQVAHKLLDGNASGDSGKNLPRISILWANRWGADALGREGPASPPRNPNSWFSLWGRAGGNSSAEMRDNQKQPGAKAASSLALQIQDLQRRHSSRFEISYFVDSEGSFIKAHDLKATLSLADLSGAKGTSSYSTSANQSCTWHSARAVELLPDDNDAARSTSLDPACACTCTPKAGRHAVIARPGVNLMCVSGPDGFIRAYTGAKRWHDGNEMQGAVRGLLGTIQRDNTMKSDEWLVLKL